MQNYFRSVAAFLMMLALSLNSSAQNYQDVKYEDGVRYSELIINSRLNDFYANKKLMGLKVYDGNGNLVKESSGSLKFDYVPGLVAKAVIEAVDYYSDKSFVLPWFYAVQDYANTNADHVPTTGGSLDDLNASKMYITLANLTGEKGALKAKAAGDTYEKATTAMKRAAEGLKDANKNFSITSSTSKNAAGGWFHKSSYPNQMWCDGQYMGPALLAQLVSMGHCIDNGKKDWKTITRQFDITWDYLWDADKQLLWHAFSASPEDKFADSWADPKTGRSQEYWGRALGWYFLALVDVLELMPSDVNMKPAQKSLAKYDKNCRKRLMQYLEAVAGGLARWQDKPSGCWYQLLAHDGNFHVDTYKGQKLNDTYNYLESSATALFAAAYLKGMRLGLLSKNYEGVATSAYKGFVNRFFKKCEDGTYTLIDCCASAGLGSKDKRDGSAAYYLLGPDITRVTTYTEGKVFGAFILAAVEWERMQDAKK